MILTLAEMTAAELAAKEQIIERGKKAFVEVGTNLAEIRDRKGYITAGFTTFEDYCKTRWGFQRTIAQYYIDAAQVSKFVHSSEQIEFTHARELARLTKPNGNGFSETSELWAAEQQRKDMRKKEIDRDAVREVASAIDFTKATVKQVAAAVDAKLKTQRQAKKQNELDAKAGSFTLSAPAHSLIKIYNRDARKLAEIVSPDVDLVFTSPPYNVGMNYRLHDDSMPANEYTKMLWDVFEQCYEVMHDGARIGVNVPFGVDRDPYRPMVPQIFDALTACGFTLVGQTIWDKGQQSIANSTAWGSYASPSAPRFRDRCEAIVWGYKILPALEIPKGANLLIDGDTFRTLAQDYWHVPPASNPNHPAVFPPALAENAIRFLGFEGCHVLDPFAGTGSTGLAAKKLNCRASLVEIDTAYCALAQEALK